MPVWLSHFEASRLLAARARASVRESGDLGLTQVDVVLEGEGALFPEGTLVRWSELDDIVGSERKCFLFEDGVRREVRVFSEWTGWVRSLCPTVGAPTMLVSGVPMHRIKGTEPWADTKTKVRALSKVRGRVLDTATGLGYSAVQLAERADEVVTVEIDPAGLEVARMNPWSRKLFESERIRQIVGDALDETARFPNGHFAAVFHDPPTIQLAGELYSLGFYRELRRILSHKGELFHYVGDPDSGLGRKITEGVIRRLHEAGFDRVERRPEAFGVVGSSRSR